MKYKWLFIAIVIFSCKNKTEPLPDIDSNQNNSVDKEISSLFNFKNFYYGVKTSVDDYRNDAIYEEIVDKTNKEDPGKIITITAENYTIRFSYYGSFEQKIVILNKISNQTLFDKYIGYTKDEILALSDKPYTVTDEYILYYGDENREHFILFYLKNNIVNKIEYGDTL
jgi:hypothetical protein